MSEIEEPRGPHRVIGTPAPTPVSVDVEKPPAEPPFDAEPENKARAKNAERLVSVLFLIAFAAGCGFIAAYIGIEVGGQTTGNVLDAVLRSNLALGLSLSVALLALGTGSLIWVRHLTPNIEIEEERHDLRSSPEDRSGLPEGVRGGRGDQPGHQAAAAAPDAAHRHRAAGAGAARAAARPRPAARHVAAVHGVAQGAAGGDPGRAPAAAAR